VACGADFADACADIRITAAPPPTATSAPNRTPHTKLPHPSSPGGCFTPSHRPRKCNFHPRLFQRHVRLRHPRPPPVKIFTRRPFNLRSLLQERVRTARQLTTRVLTRSTHDTLHTHEYVYAVFELALPRDRAGDGRNSRSNWAPRRIYIYNIVSA